MTTETFILKDFLSACDYEWLELTKFNAMLTCCIDLATEFPLNIPEKYRNVQYFIIIRRNT